MTNRIRSDKGGTLSSVGRTFSVAERHPVSKANKDYPQMERCKTISNEMGGQLTKSLANCFVVCIKSPEFMKHQFIGSTNFCHTPVTEGSK